MEKKPETKLCDECESLYFTHSSKMHTFCPECSHWLYGFSNCNHEMSEGRCNKCYWDGSVSDYLELKKGKEIAEPEFSKLANF